MIYSAAFIRLVLATLIVKQCTAFYSSTKYHLLLSSSSSTTITKWLNPKNSIHHLHTTRLQQQTITANIPFFAKLADEPKLANESKSATTSEEKLVYTPMFDFSSNATAQKSIKCFERIDDAIMGGISTSTIILPENINMNPDESFYASWSGVCRTEGGGFCGFRTLPFIEPYYPIANSTNTAGSEETDGIYARLKLTSDDEPHRRIWKFTTRTDSSRGEQVYQAEFTFPPGKDNFHTVFMPFSKFQMVRGPRIVPDSPPINISKNGIFQIGMTCSKFQMARNLTELNDFRAGYFDLHIQDIGLYQNTTAANTKRVSSNIPPQTLTSKEAKQKQPLLFKLIRPISKIFLSEQGNRRKSALKLLMTQRNMSRRGAFILGVKYRTKSLGLIKGGVGSTLGIVGMDCIRFVFGNLIRYGIFTPLFTVGKFIRSMRNKDTKNKSV